ncbi:MAG TPA: pilus assembly protein CpaE, partial [Sphingobium sp.]|nr:pilus assembly protein CpaE [Sphingobium sp.]
SRKDFETSIERKVDILIPFDLRVAAQSAKLGKTLAETAKGSKVGAACITLMEAVVGAADDVEDDGKPAKKKGDSLLGKIGDLKSMIPARRKDKATA